MNYSDVKHHQTEANRYLESAKASRLALTEAYKEPQHDRAMIADLHHAIGFAMKVAEVHALLAISTAEEGRPGAVIRDEYLADQGQLDQLRSERFKTPSRLA